MILAPVTNLKALDPQRFESLIRDLLAALGYHEARLTKRSYDGGIDVEAVNRQPLVGGKVIVQCKRYTRTVPAAAVRELYGVVVGSNAVKGILVSTSDFSSEARRFASGKPIELIDGHQVVQLLHEHGVNAQVE